MSSKSIETLTLVHENTSEKSLRLALDLLIALETEEANGKTIPIEIYTVKISSKSSKDF
jgi:hypothetical protein